MPGKFTKRPSGASKSPKIPPARPLNPVFSVFGVLKPRKFHVGPPGIPKACDQPDDPARSHVCVDARPHRASLHHDFSRRACGKGVSRRRSRSPSHGTQASPNGRFGPVAGRSRLHPQRPSAIRGPSGRSHCWKSMIMPCSPLKAVSKWGMRLQADPRRGPRVADTLHSSPVDA